MYKTTDYPARIQEARKLAGIAAITQRSRKPSVSSKLRGVLGARPEASEARKPLFISESGDVPLGVVQSVLERKTAYWGRFE